MTTRLMEVDDSCQREVAAEKEIEMLRARAEKAEAERDEAREAFVDLDRKVQDLAIETGKVSWSTPETKENK